MRFGPEGAPAAPSAPAGQWYEAIPLVARALVLAGRTLVVAGPPDLVDEPQAFKSMNDPDTRKALADHADALDGRKGALMLVVAPDDGKVLARHTLAASPVWDGMIAAGGRLYLATIDGKVHCMTGAK